MANNVTHHATQNIYTLCSYVYIYTPLDDTSKGFSLWPGRDIEGEIQDSVLSLMLLLGNKVSLSKNQLTRFELHAMDHQLCN